MLLVNRLLFDWKAFLISGVAFSFMIASAKLSFGQLEAVNYQKSIRDYNASNSPLIKAPLTKKPQVYVYTVPETEVSNRRLLVKDIMVVDSADYKLQEKIENYDLGLAPAVGQNITIERQELLNRLQMGFPLYNFTISGEESTTITRAVVVVTTDEQIALLKEFEFGQNNDDSNNLKIEILSPLQDISLAEGDLTYKVRLLAPDQTKNNGFRNWELNFFNQRLPLKKLVIRGRILQSKDVAKKNITSIKHAPTLINQGNKDLTDTLIQAQNFSNFLKKANLDNNPIITKSKLSQKTLKKHQTQNLKPLITKGKPVDLIYSTNNLLLKTAAIALEDGRLGDMIKVKNKSSHKLLLAKIISETKVNIASDN